MSAVAKFPLFLPGKNNFPSQNNYILAAEVKDSQTVFGVYTAEGGGVHFVQKKELENNSFPDFSAMVKHFMETEIPSVSVNRLAVTFPGPVIGGQSTSARVAWPVSAREISAATGISAVCIINDLEAMAYGLATITESCLDPVHETAQHVMGNVAILAPGTGLGEAGLFFDGEALRPFATEGGHSEFSPRTAVEVEFYQFLNKIYGIVSWENVLSKDGLFNIFRFLRDEKRHPISEDFARKMKQEGDFTELLCSAALEGKEKISTITVNTYLEFLAREANSLTLKLKATGGLLIGGEIPFMLRDYIDKERFYQKFLISDKMDRLLNHIPMYLIQDEHMTLNGAATYAAYSGKI